MTDSTNTPNEGKPVCVLNEFDKGYNKERSVVSLDHNCYFCQEDDQDDLGICDVMSKFYHCENCCIQNNHGVGWYHWIEEIR